MSSILQHILSVTVVIGVTFFVVAPTASAGKLSRLRDKTEEKEKQSRAPQPSRRPASRTKSAKRASTSARQPANNSHPRRAASNAPRPNSNRLPSIQHSTQRSHAGPSAARPRQIRSDSHKRSGGKLAEVSSRVHKSHAVAHRTHRTGEHTTHRHRSRGHVGYHHHRPRRSPLNLGLRIGTCAPTPSTYVYEEYYYDTPIVRAQTMEPLVMPEPYVVEEPVSPSNLPAPYCEPPVVGDEYVSPVETPVATMLKPWNVRVGIEFIGDTDGDVSQFGFDFLANATAGLGVDTDIRTLRERDAYFRDQLWLGDFNIVYELFPSEYIRPRVGIGVNWLADDYGGEAGLNLTIGADMKLLSRLTLTTEADFGTLGDADFFHANASVGTPADGKHRVVRGV